MLLIHATLSTEVSAQLLVNETPLRLFSRVAHDHVILVCILTMTININDIPATNITGLKTALMRLVVLNIFASHHDHSHNFLSNTLTKIRNGDQMIKIQRSHTLIILAINIKRSPTVNNSKKNNLRVKPRVSGTRSFAVSHSVR